MAFTLSEASRSKLAGVDPRLVRVVKRAILITPVDFKVIEGVRTRETMCAYYGKGRTAAQCEAKGVPGRYAQPRLAKVTWLNDPFSSKHGVQKNGFGHAVDLLVAPYDWKEGPQWRRMIDAVLRAAKLEGVHIRSGRDWDEDGIFEEKGETDGPHFEIVGG